MDIQVSAQLKQAIRDEIDKNHLKSTQQMCLIVISYRELKNRVIDLMASVNQNLFDVKGLFSQFQQNNALYFDG